MKSKADLGDCSIKFLYTVSSLFVLESFYNFCGNFFFLIKYKVNKYFHAVIGRLKIIRYCLTFRGS